MQKQNIFKYTVDSFKLIIINKITAFPNIREMYEKKTINRSKFNY